MKILLIPAFMLIFLYSISIIAVLLDLLSGVKKAKALGEYRSSRKLRLTVEKLVKYFNMLAVLTCIDAIQIACLYALTMQGLTNMVLIPWFTAIGSIFVCFIELKSIFEKSSDKQKADIQDAARLLNTLLADDTKRELIRDLLDKLPTKIDKYE